MKLSKLQRYTLYCIALQESEDVQYFHRGLCHLITYQVCCYRGTYRDRWCYIYNNEMFSSLLPELYEFKPKEDVGYWFNGNPEGWDNRIKLLIKCIEQTHPDNK